MSNIHNYPLTATQINDEDFYDVDYWNGVAFETRKISGATLKSVLSGAEQLNDLIDVNTGLPGSPTNADDGRILYFDIDTGTWISDDIANIANVVKDCKTTIGNTIAKGTPVALVGFDNDLLVVEPADASNPALMACIGVAAEQLDDTNAKKVVSFGELQGVNTSAFADGDVLYVANGGGFTTTRPTGTDSIQQVATVLKSGNPGGLLKIYNTSRVAGLPNLQQGNIWLGDSNGYPQEEPLCPFLASDLQLTDVIAICRWNGSSYDRFAVSADQFVQNIYNADGTLTGNRFVSGGGFALNLVALDNLLQQVAPANPGVPGWELDVDTSAMGGGDQLWKLRDTTAGLDVLQYLKSGLFVINNAYALPAADGNPGDVATTDGAGNVTFQPPAAGSGEKHIDTFYAFDMSQASGYAWNGTNVGTTTLGTINESVRVQIMAGVGGADGVFVNTSMPLNYTPGDNIAVTINSTNLATGGQFFLFVGIQEPRPGNLIGDETSTLWSATGSNNPVAAEQKHTNTVIFAGANFNNLNPGDAIAIKIYRDPGDPLDTFTGDVYLNTIGIEIQ